MENPVRDMNKEENNEPEIFYGFVDFTVYGISKGESMDHVALGKFDMERSMQFMHMISLSHTLVSVMKTKRT